MDFTMSPAEKSKSASHGAERARPLTELRIQETQRFGTVVKTRIALDESAANINVPNLNQLLADTYMLRDLYKKHHWQVWGPSFYALHLLFEKHSEEQNQLVDLLTERIQTLGGVSLAMAYDIAEVANVPRTTRGREDLAKQLERLLHAHEIVLEESRAAARQAAGNGDEGTNDLLVGDLIRSNERQSWLLSQHIQKDS